VYECAIEGVLGGSGEALIKTAQRLPLGEKAIGAHGERLRGVHARSFTLTVGQDRCIARSMNRYTSPNAHF